MASTQLIRGDGTFKVDGLRNFSEKAKLHDVGLDYAVVSIIGPQSSGKSTLLNHLFGTKFAELDPKKFRTQTTSGIWLAKAENFIKPCVLVLDVEGSDGDKVNEDVTFEKQAALFAFAMSDVIIINMPYQTVGLRNAGSLPLLSTVFEVMMRLYSSRRRTLIFVIRDMSPKMPLETLRMQVTQCMQKIYDSILKPAAHKNTPLRDLFNVQFYAFSNYETQEDVFKKEVADFKLPFSNSSASGGIAENKSEKNPASAISYTAQNIWKTIKENKDLNLPLEKIMVAKCRCEEIAKEKYEGFASSKEWRRINEAVESGSVSDFGKNLSSLLDTCLSGYDAETCYFDKNVQSLERQKLQKKLLELRRPTYQSVLKHLLAGALNDFKDALSKVKSDDKVKIDIASKDLRNRFLSDFRERCGNATITQENWQFSNALDQLSSDIDKEIVVRQEQAAVARMMKLVIKGGMFVASAVGIPCMDEIKEIIEKFTD